MTLLNADSALHANWIWRTQPDYNLYNQTIIARKVFSIDNYSSASIIISADSFYRLLINGKWVNDGPCRSWPEHFQYDRIGVTNYIRQGRNTLEIIARYYGTGTHHQVPQQAGLIVQLDIVRLDGQIETIVTDDTWQITEARQWVSNTPKLSFIMEPAEFYDARLECSEQFEKAEILFRSDKGPWKDLNRRDVALLTKKDFDFKSYKGAKVVNAEGLNFCLAAANLINPGLIEANVTVGLSCGMASLIILGQTTTVEVITTEFAVAIDGHVRDDGIYDLSPGSHVILAFVKEPKGINKERTLRIKGLDPVNLKNPLDCKYENPWSFIDTSEFVFIKDDLRWIEFDDIDPEVVNKTKEYKQLYIQLLEKVNDLQAFNEKLKKRARLISFDKMFFKDNEWKFQQRQVVSDASKFVHNPQALMITDGSVTIVSPCMEGDVELCYDLGEQNCGYYCFELEGDQGLHIDVNAVEFINDNGKLQHTGFFRNGFSYITKQGINVFTSLKRRSGRYVFITIRGHHSPVMIKNFRLIESTYPVQTIGRFDCSDKNLTRIWDISVRTLKLCMEDVFVDCPLYEQTLWVGDARNESLFAYSVFGAVDIAKRCIKLAAQSLKRFPIVCSQAPTAWQCLLPAWSFLWGISVWDYYEFTGDQGFLETMWEPVLKNIDGARSYINQEGLFSSEHWNFFDWAEIDWKKREAVLHNSMLLKGAIDAAVKCAHVLKKDKADINRLEVFRNELCSAINRFWDNGRNSYPDSLNDSGKPVESICQHTSVLSVLYDIIETSNKKHAVRNMIAPPANMVKIGSPFAILYLYEALEKEAMEDEIINSIVKNYVPMLQAGATTVWESFPGGTLRNEGFPTRSHCHAWSSAPVYFFLSIILGIRQTAPGAESFVISPRISGLSWAEGTAATIKGPVNLRWTVKDDHLIINYSVPQGVKICFETNETHQGLKVKVNGVEFVNEL